jgi:hypothetical protein
MPIIRNLSPTVPASGLALERGGSSVVGRGRSGSPDQPRPTTLLSPRYKGKAESATAVNDEHEDARNMLSCI